MGVALAVAVAVVVWLLLVLIVSRSDSSVLRPPTPQELRRAEYLAEWNRRVGAVCVSMERMGAAFQALGPSVRAANEAFQPLAALLAETGERYGEADESVS